MRNILLCATVNIRLHGQAPLHSPRELGEAMAGGGAQAGPCRGPPKPILERTCHRPSSAGPGEHRGTTQIRDLKEEAPCPGPFQGSPIRTSAPCPVVICHSESQSSSVGLRGLLPSAGLHGLQGRQVGIPQDLLWDV